MYKTKMFISVFITYISFRLVSFRCNVQPYSRSGKEHSTLELLQLVIIANEDVIEATV